LNLYDSYYSYDGNSNRVNRSGYLDADSFTYNSNSIQTTNFYGAIYNYSWGPYEQLTAKNGYNTLTVYTYTPSRLLSRISRNGSTQASYYYDALGRIIKIIEGNTTTINLYSGNDIVCEIKKIGEEETRTFFIVKW